MRMQLICHPRTTPIVVVSFRDGVFLINELFTEERGVVCLTTDTVAGAVKKYCDAYLEVHRRDKKC